MIKDGKFYKKKEGMKRMSKKILVTGCNGQLGRAINKEYVYKINRKHCIIE